MNRQSLKAIKPIYASYSALRYVAFQRHLALARLRDWRDGLDSSTVVAPPARLRYRVHGKLDRESFLRTGEILAQDIRDLCALEGRDIFSHQRILDFGCGSGRVIRNFQDAPPSCELYGTDIDAELVTWCREHLQGIRWSTNGFQPPLPYHSDTFDLIYAVSVFTHLNEEFQRAWLAELRRVAKPGATVILTVHGEYVIGTLPAVYQNRVHSDGFMFLTGATGRLKLDGLPDFYQTAYHTQEYIEREWSAYFEVVRYVERGINNHQDAVILRARRVDVQGNQPRVG